MFDLDKDAGYWSVRSSFHSSLVKAMFTPHRKAFCTDMKNCPVEYGQQRHKTGTNRSDISKIALERLAERAW